MSRIRFGVSGVASRSVEAGDELTRPDAEVCFDQGLVEGEQGRVAVTCDCRVDGVVEREPVPDRELGSESKLGRVGPDRGRGTT